MSARKRRIDDVSPAEALRQYSRHVKRIRQRDTRAQPKTSARSATNVRAFDRLRQHTLDVKKTRQAGPQPQPPKPVLRECTICADELPAVNFPHNLTHHCPQGNTICTTCWHTHLSTELTSKATSEIRCPQCPYKLQEGDMKVLATKATYTAYLDKIFNEFLQKDPNYRTCPSATCTFGYIMTQDDAQSDSIFNCRVCEAQYCVRCEVLMHKGISCREYKEETQHEKQKVKDEKASKTFLKRYAKECPHCHVLIRKAGGCDHMTCYKCSHEFCWVCFAPYGGSRGIHRAGNAAHNKECAYRPDRLPPVPDLQDVEDSDDDDD